MVAHKSPHIRGTIHQVYPYVTARADLRAASSPKVGAKSRFGPNPGLNFKPYHANVLTDRGKFPTGTRT